MPRRKKISNAKKHRYARNQANTRESERIGMRRAEQRRTAPEVEDLELPPVVNRNPPIKRSRRAS